MVKPEGEIAHYIELPAQTLNSIDIGAIDSTLD